MAKDDDNSLKNQWTGNTDFLVLDGRNFARYQAVLEQVYRDVYAPNFPVSAGYESLQDFLDILKDPQSPIDLKVTIAGVGMRDPAGPAPQLKGICISFYYKESDSALLTYLAVDPAYRTEGLGTALYRQHNSAMLDSARLNGGTLKGNYISLQDPLKPLSAEHQEFDTYDPFKRFNKYINWGGQRVPFDYIYGGVEHGKIVTGDECALIAFKHPVDGTLPARQTTLSFMRSLWRAHGVQEPEKHPEFQKMVASYKEEPPAAPPPRPQP